MEKRKKVVPVEQTIHVMLDSDIAPDWYWDDDAQSKFTIIGGFHSGCIVAKNREQFPYRVNVSLDGKFLGQFDWVRIANGWLEFKRVDHT